MNIKEQGDTKLKVFKFVLIIVILAGLLLYYVKSQQNQYDYEPCNHEYRGVNMCETMKNMVPPK